MVSEINTTRNKPPSTKQLPFIKYTTQRVISSLESSKDDLTNIGTYKLKNKEGKTCMNIDGSFSILIPSQNKIREVIFFNFTSFQ